MTYKKIIPIFVFFFLFLSIVNAQGQPQFTPQSGDQDTGFEVAYPPLSVIEINEDHEFHFHVFNETTGVPIVDGISCGFHLYNQTGNQIHTEVIETVDPIDGVDYETTVRAGNFSSVGTYAYTIFCNNSVQGGYNTVPVTVTLIGSNVPHNGNYDISLVLILIAASFLTFLIGNKLKMDKEEDEEGNRNPLKIGFNILLRATFYMFSIGFVMIGIGSLNQATQSTVMRTVITSSVSLISRFQYWFFIIMFLIFLIWIVQWIMGKRYNSSTSGRFDR